MKNNKQIHDRLLKKEFLKQKKALFTLRDCRKKGLYLFLKEQGFGEVATQFYKENVDGLGFIIILTEEEEINSLEHEFNFTTQQIHSLKQFYLDIFQFRKRFCLDFDEDETPFYG